MALRKISAMDTGSSSGTARRPAPAVTGVGRHWRAARARHSAPRQRRWWGCGAWRPPPVRGSRGRWDALRSGARAAAVRGAAEARRRRRGLPREPAPPPTTTARCEGEGAARRLCSTLGSIRWGGHGRRLTRARRRGCRTARGSRYGRGAGEMASERVRRPGAADPAGPRAAPSRSRRTRRTRGAAQARSRPDCSSRSPSAPRGQASACRRRRSARTSDGLCTCVIKR